MKLTSSSLRVPSRSNWTKQEDETLAALVYHYGPQNWAVLANSLQGRTGKQCRERWHNHLAPGVVKTDWSAEEDAILQAEYLKVGSKWAKIAEKLPGRTDNAVKNRFYSQKRKTDRLTGRPPLYTAQKPILDTSALRKRKFEEEAALKVKNAKIKMTEITTNSPASKPPVLGKPVKSEASSITLPLLMTTRLYGASAASPCSGASSPFSTASYDSSPCSSVSSPDMSPVSTIDTSLPSFNMGVEFDDFVFSNAYGLDSTVPDSCQSPDGSNRSDSDCSTADFSDFAVEFSRDRSHSFSSFESSSMSSHSPKQESLDELFNDDLDFYNFHHTEMPIFI
eukprot:GILK01001493.1.p1 GENE.GILK01001493.1~~GILK01001493.1.p1  ORF type:complete len:337 (+),score=62.59 GILK01001493.1:116-1126(+)